ncbi:MAG: hemolysin III family protein [Acidimicrobiia bacterium]|nr:hemolysin III family protein [Acidimicrobiia bacterium]MDH4364118.1 hemolysin III family protein [Acidimicrobiia bacterium]
MVTVLHPTPMATAADMELLPAIRAIYGARPRLRGRLHQLAAVLSVPVGIELTAAASPDARPAVAVYAVTWSLMLTTSAAYHRLAQSVAARFWMRRLDHSMILVHIAGSTTPVALLGVGGRGGTALLLTSWTVAALASALKLLGLTELVDPGAWGFPALGLLPLVGLPALAGRAGVDVAALLALSIAVYGAGAVCFHRHRPDPFPTVFGYHEVWHVVTLVGGALQLIMTIQLVGAATGG